MVSARARALRPAIEGHRTHGQLLLAWPTIMDGRSSFLLREWRADRSRSTTSGAYRAWRAEPTYHHETLALGDDEAEQLLGKVRRSIAACTTLAFHRLAADLSPRYRVSAITIRQPPLADLPSTVAEVHALSRNVSRRWHALSLGDLHGRPSTRLEGNPSSSRRGGSPSRRGLAEEHA